MRPQIEWALTTVGAVAAAAPPGARTWRGGGLLMRRRCLALRLRLHAGEHVDSRHLQVVAPKRRKRLVSGRGREVRPVVRVVLGPEAVVPERDRRQILEEDLLDLTVEPLQRRL